MCFNSIFYNFPNYSNSRYYFWKTCHYDHEQSGALASINNREDRDDRKLNSDMFDFPCEMHLKLFSRKQTQPAL